MSTLTCGVDEAGRGPLAGPVVAAAVILPPGTSLSGLNDSKKLSPRQRERLAAEIRATALAWAVAEASAAEIDAWNILRSTLRAMARAVAALPLTPDEVLVDGNQAPALEVPVRTIIGGDALEPAIMAASILAKTHRDARLVALEARHPGYGFARHKGYGTAAHLAALARLGPCPEHRRSFAPVRAALERMGR
ncbi:MULTISPECIES: ribonuclease HII [Tepidiphilus]|jgi:ribonuclease HII|uniref:Ribonuclease HII n=1 Tax=Tepidiphilus thermophilus TaxID=876478 RepID=A0A0K6IVR2_9PROT|nr:MULTISPECIES: ribonuclease HII [Tepidiphilus]CUB07432.1 RNase HII [Tepidiphilus thermophilus]